MRKKCAQNKLRRESKTLKVKNMNKKILEDEQEVRSFSVLYESHKGFKEKKAIKTTCDGVSTALEFILKLSHSFGLIQ